MILLLACCPGAKWHVPWVKKSYSCLPVLPVCIWKLWRARIMTWCWRWQLTLMTSCVVFVCFLCSQLMSGLVAFLSFSIVHFSVVSGAIAGVHSYWTRSSWQWACCSKDWADKEATGAVVARMYYGAQRNWWVNLSFYFFISLYVCFAWWVMQQHLCQQDVKKMLLFCIVNDVHQHGLLCNMTDSSWICDVGCD